MAVRDEAERRAHATAPASAKRRATALARAWFCLAGTGLALAIVAAGSALARGLGLGVEIATVVVAASALGLGGVALGGRLDALEQKTLEDPMTCVGNRRLWERSLAAEVDRAVHARMPLSVLMIDLDHFKSINDAHGHSCGDRALSLVARVLRETCRSRDVAVRLGGDEFAVLLPRTRLLEARVVAERVRSEIARQRGELGAPLSSLLTVSVGVADLEGVAEPTPRALFESADRALYLAKSAGRDRIEVRAPARRISGVIRLDERRGLRKGRESA
jgi:diguanylate cyclase (GGDEF)-like protein